jgi:hypothetical protein
VIASEAYYIIMGDSQNQSEDNKTAEQTNTRTADQIVKEYRL